MNLSVKKKKIHDNHQTRINSQRESTLGLRTANDVLASRNPNGRASDALGVVAKYLQTFDAMYAGKRADTRAMLLVLRNALEHVVKAIA